MSLYQLREEEGEASQEFPGIHQTMICGPWEQPIQSLSMPGLIGTTMLLDYRKSRQLSIEYRIQDFESYSAIMSALSDIDSLNQRLVGAVVMYGTLRARFDKCVFMGFERGEPRWDAGGNHDWWIEGKLHWVQRSPNS